MVGCGEKARQTIRPEFDRSIMMNFRGKSVEKTAYFEIR
jgi:hypothetical protein